MHRRRMHRKNAEDGKRIGKMMEGKMITGSFVGSEEGAAWPISGRDFEFS